MSSFLNRLAGPWPDTLGGVLRVVAVAMGVWALAATLLSFLAPGVGSFQRVLVFSECVGFTMVACVLALRRARPVARLRPATRWLVVGIVAIPAGFVVGHQVAFLLLGEPLRMVGVERISVIPVFFTVLVGGLGLHVSATREQLAREAAARSEAQRLAVESQLRLLRAQLEPHMLFNTLANVRSLMREDVDRAESMIDQLMVYLRSALAASQTESVALSREFAQLRAYLDIMSLRMGPRLSYRLELPAALEDMPVPPMLLQPLVENAIKHGLEPKVGPGSIEVVARAVDAGIEIRVSDSGLGLPVDDEALDAGPSARPANASYGLQHVRDRLRALYGPAGRLRLERRAPTGVSAVVRIPT
jgi:signal transduction histidine kinase